MDSRFDIKDPPRELPRGASAETALVSLAWRAVRSDCKRRAQEKLDAQTETERLRRIVADVAEGVYRLRRAAGISHQEQAAEPSDLVRQLEAISTMIEQALAAGGVRIEAPEGAPFTGEWTDLFENIAPKPDPSLQEPEIAEVVTPAVLCRGDLLRMGKAVIGVPSKQGTEKEKGPSHAE